MSILTGDNPFADYKRKLEEISKELKQSYINKATKDRKKQDAKAKDALGHDRQAFRSAIKKSAKRAKGIEMASETFEEAFLFVNEETGEEIVLTVEELNQAGYVMEEYLDENKIGRFVKKNPRTATLAGAGAALGGIPGAVAGGLVGKKLDTMARKKKIQTWKDKKAMRAEEAESFDLFKGLQEALTEEEIDAFVDSLNEEELMELAQVMDLVDGC